MKKLACVMLAVCFAILSALTFAACDSNIELPLNADGKYYAYDAVSEEYNDKDCLEVDGDKCKMIANFYGMQMSVDGTVEYDGSSFVVRCSLGEDDDTMDIAMYGEVEADGVIRFFRQEVTMGGKTNTQHEEEYYCKKGSAPKKQQSGDSDGVYYEYDPSANTHDKNSSVTVNGNACKFSIIDGDSGYNIDMSGKASFTDSSFTLDCTALGVRMVYTGVKEKDGVLRVNSVTTSLAGYEGFSDTDNTVIYFCKDGISPDNPEIGESTPPLSDYHTVTFDANGGMFYSNNTYFTLTDRDGKVTLPYSKPTRDGYVFVRYNTKRDGTGKAVDETTTFGTDTVVYAQWASEVTVTFKSDGLNIAKKKVGKGMPLGDFTVPGLEDNYKNNYLFKGWYYGGKQYLSYTTVEKDITLTAEWYTESEVQSYIDGLGGSTKPGHIYIHYWRFDHDHSDEGNKSAAAAPMYSAPMDSKTYGERPIYVAPDSDSKGNGRYFYPAKIDMSGAVYDIDYTYIYHDAGDDGDLDAFYGNGALWVTLCAGKNHDDYFATDGGDRYLSDIGSDYFAYDHVFFVQDYTYRKVYYNSKTGRFW